MQEEEGEEKQTQTSVRNAWRDQKEDESGNSEKWKCLDDV